MSNSPPPTATQSIAGTPLDAALPWPDAARRAHFHSWLQALPSRYALQAASLRLASADASFRRYLRIDGAGQTLIIMDAPPDKEDCQPFVQVAQLMQAAGVRVPEILEWDQTHGFILLTDLGPRTMMQGLNPEAEPPLQSYMEAVDVLLRWQLASRPGVLPPYDRTVLLRELQLYPQYYIAQHRKKTLSEKQNHTLADAFERIMADNLAWPSVFVHRDFMPRNLMPSPAGMGVLDFQDAVYGPITYDIASLMRDAFISWDESFCLDVTVRYWQKARKAGLPVGSDFGEFYRGVEWMGLQRHIKIAGIFARLTLRDGKPQYLVDTPRFIAYIRATCSRYMELKPLLRLVEELEDIQNPGTFVFGRS